jgi:hypothetical protein
MPRTISLDQVKAMSLEERDRLYLNALKLGTPEAKELIDLMVQHGLLVTSTGGLPHHHPIIMRIEEIVASPEGRQAAKAAADNGRPALAGVDPLLQDALGTEYGGRDTTNWAGTFVADEMRKLGYTQKGQRPLPAGSVAKTGAFFVAEERRATS